MVWIACVAGICLLITSLLFLKIIVEKSKYKLIPSKSIEYIGYYYYIIGLLGFPMDSYGFQVDSIPECSVLPRFLQYVISLFILFKNKAVSVIWIGFVPIVFLITPEAIEEVLNGTTATEKAWFYNWIHSWLGTGLLTSHGKKWKSRRKLLTPAFHFDILKDFLPIINEKSMQLIDILKEDSEKEYTNIVEPLTLCSLDIICETTLGINVNAQQKGQSAYVKAVLTVTNSFMKRFFSLWSWFDFTYFLTEGRIIKKDLKLLHNFTMSLIQEKKRKMLDKSYQNNSNRKRKPLIEVLLEHHIETKDLTEEDIREEVDTFTFEGHDTTSMAMTYALYLIGLYKVDQEKIHEELQQIFGDDTERAVVVDDLKDMKYLECVLKETLRLYPSVPIIGRKSDRDMNICGYEIPTGSTLVICPYFLHRMESIYPNPEIFDPSRFTPENSVNHHPYAYIPFSAGPRNCIGQRFAMMEVKTVFANILRNFTLESLDQRDKVVTSAELVLRPVREIRIKFRPRNKTKS